MEKHLFNNNSTNPSEHRLQIAKMRGVKFLNKKKLQPRKKSQKNLEKQKSDVQDTLVQHCAKKDQETE